MILAADLGSRRRAAFRWSPWPALRCDLKSSFRCILPLQFDFCTPTGGSCVYLAQQKQLVERIRAALHSLYQIEVENVVLEQPPDLAFGEYATPIAFELARKLRKAPRKIAEELVAALGAVPGFLALEVAGAGYINARLDRAAAVKAYAISTSVPASSATASRTSAGSRTATTPPCGTSTELPSTVKRAAARRPT